MKNDLNPFVPGQLLLLKTGEFVYIMDVDPETRYKNDDSRNCNCRMGHIYKKDEEFKKKSTDFGLIEDERNNQMIAIDMAKIRNFKLSELMKLTATSFGRLSEQKMSNFAKIAGDMYERNGW